MPEPPGGRGQKSIFAFPGFKKYVQVKGVLHEVVPPALDDFDAKHPLLCRWGCGERFSRGAAKANHEKACKKQCRAPEAPRAQAEEVEMEETVPDRSIGKAVKDIAGDKLDVWLDEKANRKKWTRKKISAKERRLLA